MLLGGGAAGSTAVKYGDVVYSCQTCRRCLPALAPPVDGEDTGLWTLVEMWQDVRETMAPGLTLHVQELPQRRGHQV